MKYIGMKSLELIVSQIKTKFAPIYHNHSCVDVIDLPTIPTKMSELENDLDLIGAYESAVGGGTRVLRKIFMPI